MVPLLPFELCLSMTLTYFVVYSSKCPVFTTLEQVRYLIQGCIKYFPLGGKIK